MVIALGKQDLSLVPLKADKAKPYWQTFAQGKFCHHIVQYMHNDTAARFMQVLQGAGMVTAADSLSIRKIAAIKTIAEWLKRPDRGSRRHLELRMMAYFPNDESASPPCRWIPDDMLRLDPEKHPIVLISNSELAQHMQHVTRLYIQSWELKHSEPKAIRMMECLEKWPNVTGLSWNMDASVFLTALSNREFNPSFLESVKDLAFLSVREYSHLTSLNRFSLLEKLELRLHCFNEEPSIENLQLPCLRELGLKNFSFNPQSRQKTFNFPALTHLSIGTFDKIQGADLKRLAPLENLQSLSLNFERNLGNSPSGEEMIAFLYDHPHLQTLTFMASRSEPNHRDKIRNYLRILLHEMPHPGRERERKMERLEEQARAAEERDTAEMVIFRGYANSMEHMLREAGFRVSLDLKIEDTMTATFTITPKLVALASAASAAAPPA